MPLGRRESAVSSPTMTFRPPPVPTLGQDPTFSAHRKGLEGQVLELSSLYRRSQLQVKEYKDQLRRAEVKIGGLEDGAAAAQSKLATLESIKEYSKDLQSRLAFAEHQLESRRSETGGLRDQMANTRRLYEDSKKREETLERRYKEEQMTVERLEGEKGTLKEEINLVQGAVVRERNEIKAAHEELHACQVKLQRSEEEKVALRREHKSMERDVERHRLDLDQSKNEAAQLAAEVEALNRADRRELATRAEVETLRSDNSRLLKLLKSTKEYCDFQLLWEDSNGVAYVPQVPFPPSGNGVVSSPNAVGNLFPESAAFTGLSSSQNGGLEGVSSREDAAALYGQSFVNQQERMVEWADLEVVASRYSMNADDVDPSREAEAWVPHAAMRIAKDFHTVHLPHVPVAIIHDFLRKMNGVWRSREAQHVERLRLTFKEQLDEYIRRANQDKSYEAVMAEWSIKRLKKDVKAARSKLLHASAKPSKIQAATTAKKGKAATAKMGRNASPGLAAMSGISGDQLLEASINVSQRLSVQLQQEKAKQRQQQQQPGLKDHFNPNTELSPAKFDAPGVANAPPVVLGGSRSPFKQPRSPDMLHFGRGSSPNWWDSHNAAMREQALENANGQSIGAARPGGQAYMAGAAWFGHSAVFIQDALGDDLESLRGETMQQLKDLGSHTPLHSSAERAMLLEHAHKRFLHELDARLTSRRKQLRDIYEAVLDHPPGDDKAFERLEKNMPKSP